MLKATNKEQVSHIADILGVEFEECSIGKMPIKEIQVDKPISFDNMEKIVEYLKSQRCKRTKEEIEALKKHFEECWKAYRRKGSKGKALEYFLKLSDENIKKVMPHIKVYAQTRELRFQRDFERYLRDKNFLDVINDGNNIVYDPSKEDNEEAYVPTCEGMLSWNDYYKSYVFTGMFLSQLVDGYTRDNRPNGARIMLHNGRGFITWNSNKKHWYKDGEEL